MRKVAIVALVVLAHIAVLGAAIGVHVATIIMPWVQSSGPRPSDEAMIAHWRKKRTTFEQLAAMMTKDGTLKRLGRDWSEPDDPGTIGIPPERIALYRRLLRDADIISASHYGPQIAFIYFTSGITVAGSAKSFCYGPPPDSADEIDGDLDAARRGLRDFRLQRHIEGDWWLQYHGT
jgi:hypothetical protein